MAQQQIATHRVATRDDSIKRWVDERLAEAPAIAPEQAATLSDLMADARNKMSGVEPRSLSGTL